jgi:hypothetical protein
MVCTSPRPVQFAKDQAFIVGESSDKPCRMCADSWIVSDLGKGLHSDAGEAKIRSALEDHFTKYVRWIVPLQTDLGSQSHRRGPTHSLDPRNAGVLIVRLQ